MGKLADKWRLVQSLLEELANEDADAVHMHNSARFDVFQHGISWARGMADFHDRQENNTPEERQKLRRWSDEDRARHVKPDARWLFIPGDRVISRYRRPAYRGTVVECKSDETTRLCLLHIQWDDGAEAPMLDSNYVWREIPETF